VETRWKQGGTRWKQGGGKIEAIWSGGSVKAWCKQGGKVEKMWKQDESNVEARWEQC
jgi:hypothetical protein